VSLKMQTRSKNTDAFCSYNQSAGPFFYYMAPSQYRNDYVLGETGVFPSGGTAGSYQPPQLIDVSSFLLGLDNVLSKCVPPAPSLGSIQSNIPNYNNTGKNNTSGTRTLENFENSATNITSNNLPGINQKAIDSMMKHPTLRDFYNKTVPDVTGPIQLQEDISYLLLPKYTKELRSVNSLDAIDFNRFVPSLPVNPQNLRYVIEDVSPQRGGLNTRDYVKSAWSNRNNSPNYDPSICGTTLSPNTDCGPDCTGIAPKSVPYQGFTNKLPNEPDFPFVDPSPAQLYSIGMSSCSPRSFYGMNYDQGSCPNAIPQVLKNNGI
jgi:hypothetical protein